MPAQAEVSTPPVIPIPATNVQDPRSPAFWTEAFEVAAMFEQRISTQPDEIPITQPMLDEDTQQLEQLAEPQDNLQQFPIEDIQQPEQLLVQKGPQFTKFGSEFEFSIEVLPKNAD